MDGAIGSEAIDGIGSGGWSEAEAEVLLAGRYRLLPGRRIPSLDSPRALAYEAVDVEAPARALFCLISPVEALPRLPLARSLSATPVDGLLNPCAAGYCRWPSLGGAAAAFLFPRPKGSRLRPGAAAGLSTAELSRRVLKPLARVLATLEARGVTHRAIRADNLFWADAAESEIVLGECVSAAAGADQPALYEPLDRMTATQLGRGEGAPADDLYALGVTLIDILYGLRSGQAYPPHLVFRKLEHGTLTSLLPRVSPAPELAGLLRGLLSDEVRWRWTPRHLSRWIAGERVDPPSPSGQATAQRAIFVDKARFRSARSLAHGLSREPELAVKLLRDGTVEQWLRVSLGEARLASLVGREVQEAQKRPGARGSARNILLQRCCRLLDPAGPVRFGGISIMPDGVGTALAALVLQGHETSEFEALLRSLAANDLLGPVPEQDLASTDRFNAAVGFLNAGGPAGGVHRALYELNPDLPCMSPALTEPMSDVRELLEALDRSAFDLPDSGPLADRHVTAFVASRLGLHPLQLAGVAQNGNGQASDAQNELRLLGHAQAYYGPPALRALARAAAVRLSPIIRSIHNRADRKRLAAAIAACVEQGDLSSMIAHVDDVRVWERDRVGLQRARREFAMCSRELERLRDAERSGLSQAQREGQKVATAVSLSLALAIVCSVLAIS